MFPQFFELIVSLIFVVEFSCYYVFSLGEEIESLLQVTKSLSFAKLRLDEFRLRVVSNITIVVRIENYDLKYVIREK